jgi:stage IV sporulation protein B
VIYLIKKVGIGLFCVLIILFLSYYFIVNGLPKSFSIIRGNESIINIKVPLDLDLYVSGNNSELSINGKKINEEHLKINAGELVFKAENIGSSDLKFKLFGLIPIRSITVKVLPEVEVYPGGQAIGVLLRSRGVMVVGNSYVEDQKGKRHYPAQNAGIRVGDKILEINEEPVHDKVKLAMLIQDYARKNEFINLLVEKRDGSQKNIRIKPEQNKEGRYMIGLYVDDGVAGVGTLTFINPESKEYGALGHEIVEANSQLPIDLREGKIIEAQISGINSGQRGLPGEKLGTFFQNQQEIGTIEKNNRFGIYGTLKRLPENPFFKEPIPVAMAHEVQVGPAKIYTVLNGGKIEEFDAYIEKVFRQAGPTEKGLIVNITDPALQEITGGIIQGMSGSPIVQNNKLVGAITHVFVNEPTKGYGIFAEWMIMQTRINIDSRAGVR